MFFCPQGTLVLSGETPLLLLEQLAQLAASTGRGASANMGDEAERIAELRIANRERQLQVECSKHSECCASPTVRGRSAAILRAS